MRAQHNKSVYFEVHPTALYEYPGNYTVTAFTNDAVRRRAVHSIIMPEFCESFPFLCCHDLSCGIVFHCQRSEGSAELLIAFAVALQPPHYEVQVSWGSVAVKWEEPKLFPTSCTYLVDAIPYDKNASRVIQEPFYNFRWVVFYTLTPVTKYSINLGSNCTGSEPFWFHLGDVETDAGGKGKQIKLLLYAS